MYPNSSIVETKLKGTPLAWKSFSRVLFQIIIEDKPKVPVHLYLKWSQICVYLNK